MRVDRGEHLNTSDFEYDNWVEEYILIIYFDDVFSNRLRVTTNQILIAIFRFVFEYFCLHISVFLSLINLLKLGVAIEETSAHNKIL